jgi:hypothetical protein
MTKVYYESPKDICKSIGLFNHPPVPVLLIFCPLLSEPDHCYINMALMPGERSGLGKSAPHLTPPLFQLHFTLSHANIHLQLFTWKHAARKLM